MGSPVETNSALSTLKKRICPSYAVVFDEKKEATKLVHWKTYEKIHLPGFLEEREKYLGMMKKQMSTAVESVASKAETATPASKTVEAIKNVSAPSIAPPEDPVEQAVMASIAPAPSKAKPFTADSELPQGPLTLLYDAKNQYIKLISWDEYAEKFQHKDVAEWGKMKEIIPAEVLVLEQEGATATIEAASITSAEVKSFVEETPISVIPVPASKHVSPTSAVIYDEASQMVKLVSWDAYKEEHLPGFLELRKERELL